MQDNGALLLWLIIIVGFCVNRYQVAKQKKRQRPEKYLKSKTSVVTEMKIETSEISTLRKPPQLK